MKKILSIFLVCVFLGGSALLLLSGIQLDNTELNLARDFSMTIYGQNRRTMFSTYIKGLDEEEDYILTYNNEGGYAIFNREDMELIEYSSTGNPYFDIGKDISYYAGPANYYKKSDNKFENLRIKQQVDKDRGSIVGKSIRNKIKTDKIALKTDKIALARTTLNATESTITNYVPTDQYLYFNREYIENKDYFLSKPYHEINQYGTCTTIATQLLLGYNDWAVDGRLITNPAFLEIGNYIDSSIEEGDNQNDINENTLPKPLNWYSISTTRDFYLYLLEEIDPEGYEVEMKLTSAEKSDGASLDDAKRGINYYLSTCVDSNVASGFSVVTINNKASAYYALKEEIDNDRPALASLYYIDTSTMEEISHMVVVYGYQTFIGDETNGGQNIEGFICHYGHGPSTNNVWVNSSWVRGCLSLESSHEHSETFEDSVQHIKKCTICNTRIPTEEHSYVNYIDILDEKHHVSKCDICEAFLEEEHTYYFTQESAVQHAKRCTKCSFAKYGGHNLKYEGQCYDCGVIH